MADEDNSARCRHGGLDHTHDIGNGKACEKWPHREVLKARRRGGELVAERVVFHIDPDQIIESRSWETENARYFFRVEEIRGLVPMYPHPPEVITQEIVQRIPREKA